MSIRAFAIAATVAALVPAAVSLAQPFGPGGRGPGWSGGNPPCMAADSNGDGTVSADEIAAFRASRQAQRPMLRADTNGDGVITAEERAAFQAQRWGGMPCPWASGAAGAGAAQGAGAAGQ